MNPVAPSKQPIVLFDNGYHKCICFSNLVSGDGVQANQFLIVHKGHAAVIDPGGDLTFTPLTIELMKYVKLQELDYVIASHQDPDIIASMPRWLIHTPAKIVASKLWARFLPHLASNFMAGRMGAEVNQRIIELPDRGDVIPLGDSVIYAVPAHFLHSVGNFQFYDPVSKILFTGDMGASLLDDVSSPVEDIESHIQYMRGFHQRYMCSRRVTRLWAEMVRGMDVSMLVPQHGAAMKGEAIKQFLDWIGNLDCGIDLLTQVDYQIPALHHLQTNAPVSR